MAKAQGGTRARRLGPGEGIQDEVTDLAQAVLILTQRLDATKVRLDLLQEGFRRLVEVVTMV